MILLDENILSKIDNRRNKLFYKTLDWFVAENGTSRAEIAKNCRLSYSSLNKSKKSNGRWISLGNFFKICDVLDITPFDFLDQMEILNLTNDEERK